MIHEQHRKALAGHSVKMLSDVFLEYVTVYLIMIGTTFPLILPHSFVDCYRSREDLSRVL